jgi:nicotinate phosphoribosyltransferase
MAKVGSNEVLLVDVNELATLGAHFTHGLQAPAVFELSVRSLPASRSFLVAAGLEQALDFLEHLSFGSEELEYIARSGLFSSEFVHQLEDLRFTGDVDAVPEGTVVFENEPLLRVTAPLPEAQLVETRLTNLVHFETLIASKAARAVLAAPGKLLVDCGVQRAHGFEAGLLAARAAHIAGFAGTSTVIAGSKFDIPLYGTMTRSLVAACDDESQAFRAFARSLNDRAVLLIDVFDAEQAARKVVRLKREWVFVGGVCICGRDQAEHAHRVRKILDEGGLESCTILAGGQLDEYAVRDLLATSAPIDGFVLGTSLDTSADAPLLDCTYELEEYAGHACRAHDRGTWAGKKQVFRHVRQDGLMDYDTVVHQGQRADGEPLLVPYMRGGRRVAAAEASAMPRSRASSQLASLPPELKELDVHAHYPVRIAPELQQVGGGRAARVASSR